jgi:hypothetical protein
VQPVTAVVAGLPTEPHRPSERFPLRGWVERSEPRRPPMCATASRSAVVTSLDGSKGLLSYLHHPDRLSCLCRKVFADVLLDAVFGPNQNGIL